MAENMSGCIYSQKSKECSTTKNKCKSVLKHNDVHCTVRNSLNVFMKLISMWSEVRVLAPESHILNFYVFRVS